MPGHEPNPLDRPAWSALTTLQASFSLGKPPAQRFRPSVEPFISSADDHAASLQAMRALMHPDEELIIIQQLPSELPDGILEVERRAAVQMVADPVGGGQRPPEAVPLGAADVEAMQELAELTRPGPFRAETWKLGTFWGVWRGSRLIAMAGERLRFPGWVELSGVCTHPDARGTGLARRLSQWKMVEIAATGQRVFLHAYKDNEAAIALYRDLGFSIRSAMSVQVIRLADPCAVRAARLTRASA
jgi:ribosomal protein S18 acetylase RimI-like enzyme